MPEATEHRATRQSDRARGFERFPGVAQHRFCGVCGIKAFYVPRSNPDGIDINVRCLDDDPRRTFGIEPFDGRDWERSGAALALLSSESR